jgi:dCTP deaminase
MGKTLRISTAKKHAYIDGGVLTTEAIRSRLESHDPQFRIYLKPILDDNNQVGDGSVDIRLGTHFLVPRTSDLSHITPEKMDAEYVRQLQSAVVKEFGDRFTLHPNHLVLGVTFEYLKLPGDIAAMVLSRSSFGRVGLVVATATYVHPLWEGCLTLELANYGEIPLEIPCGSPIAQLVFIKASRIKNAQILTPGRNACPIRPEFALLQKMPDWNKLAGIRKELSRI